MKRRSTVCISRLDLLSFQREHRVHRTRVVGLSGQHQGGGFGRWAVSNTSVAARVYEQDHAHHVAALRGQKEGRVSEVAFLVQPALA